MKFAAPSPPSVSTFKEDICANVNTKESTEGKPNIFQINLIKKLDKILKRTEKESIKNTFLLKSYKGFCPGTNL